MKTTYKTMKTGLIVLMIAACTGCTTVIWQPHHAHAPREATLVIDGTAKYVNLEYTLVRKKNARATHNVDRVSQLGDRPKKLALPLSLPVLVRPGDTLHLHCALLDSTKTARLRVLYEKKERRSYKLARNTTSIYINHKF